MFVIQTLDNGFNIEAKFVKADSEIKVSFKLKWSVMKNSNSETKGWHKENMFVIQTFDNW